MSVSKVVLTGAALLLLSIAIRPSFSQEDYQIDDPATKGTSALKILDISAKGRTPGPHDAPYLTSEPETPASTHMAAPKSFTWHSDRICYQRLMFEEPMLERHGISKGEKIQVAESAIRFFSRALFFRYSYFAASTVVANQTSVGTNSILSQFNFQVVDEAYESLGAMSYARVSMPKSA